MAYTLPNEDAPSISLGKAFTRGTSLYNTLMQNAIAKQRAQNEKATLEREAQLFPLKQAHLAALTNSAQSNADWNNLLMGNNPNQNANPMPNQNNRPQGNYNAVQQKFPLNKRPMVDENGETVSNLEEMPQQANQNIGMGEQLGAEQVLQPGDPNKYFMDEHAGIKGIPPVQTHYDSNGNIITKWPSGKLTKQQIGPTARESKFNESLDKSDAKIVGEMQEASIEAQDLKQSYDVLNEAFNNPLWNKMHSGLLSKGGEKGRKLQMDVIRNYGTDAQKELLATVDTTSNELVSKMAKVFKGPFRIAEQGLIEKVKPQSYDTPQAAMQKLMILNMAIDKQQYLNMRIPELITKNKMSANDAFKIAFNEVGGKEFKEELNKKYASEKNKNSSNFNLKVESEKLGISPEDVKHTAELKGITEQDVIERYKGAQNGA